jgi:phosphoribosyl-AMP cyclohydrolase
MNQLDRVRLLGEIDFNEAGLVPAIAQDATTGRVLMMAWMNAEAITQTLATGYAHYYSRSRGKQWRKGETSGHVQKIVDIYLDCDGDTLLLKVEQTGPACHTNRESCFYRKLDGKDWTIIEEPIA